MSSVVHMLPVGSAWCQWDSQFRAQAAVDSLYQCTTHTLLLGEDGIGKTSLAFQAAVSMATEGQQVTIIRPRVLGRLPLPVHGMPPPLPPAMALLHFWYPDKAEEVVKWCGNIHMQALLPEVIIVDDFDFYCAQSKSAEHGAARLCACLLDAAHWISQKRGQQCRVMLTASHGLASLSSVCRQFHFLQIHLSERKEEGVGGCQLKCVRPTDCATLTYTITPQHIRLQSVDISSAGKSDGHQS